MEGIEYNEKNLEKFQCYLSCVLWVNNVDLSIQVARKRNQISLLFKMKGFQAINNRRIFSFAF